MAIKHSNHFENILTSGDLLFFGYGGNNPLIKTNYELVRKYLNECSRLTSAYRSVSITDDRTDLEFAQITTNKIDCDVAYSVEGVGDFECGGENSDPQKLIEIFNETLRVSINDVCNRIDMLMVSSGNIFT